MEMRIERITPAIARRYLERNGVNRRMRQSWVMTLRLAFARGEYHMTHQGIAFDQGGMLIDGQHRLTAIAGLPENSEFEFAVWRGLDAKTSGEGIDTGVKRTSADILALPARLVETARLLVRFYHGSGETLTPPVIYAATEPIAQIHGMLMDTCGAGARTWSSAPVRAAGVLLMLRLPKQREHVCTQYRALVLGDFNVMTNSTQALYRAGARGAVRAAQQRDLFARCWRALDPSRAHVTKIQISDMPYIMNEAREVMARTMFAASWQTAEAPRTEVPRSSEPPWTLTTEHHDEHA